MNTETIDTAMARRLVDALAIQGDSIIGQPEGCAQAFGRAALGQAAHLAQPGPLRGLFEKRAAFIAL